MFHVNLSVAIVLVSNLLAAPSTASTANIPNDVFHQYSVSPGYEGETKNLSARPNELLIIDAAVSDKKSLIDKFGTDTEIHFLNSDSDGISQIARIVENRSDISALHLVSHGAPEQLFLGGNTVSVESISGQHKVDLTAIGRALSAEADILIYACDFVGNGDVESLQVLSQLTGADIAASDDRTGLSAYGGDWDLEKSVGDIQANPLNAPGWRGVLADASVDIQTTLVPATASSHTTGGDTYTFGNGSDMHITGMTGASGVNYEVYPGQSRVVTRTIDNNYVAGGPRSSMFSENSATGSGDYNYESSFPGTPGAFDLTEVLGGTIVNRGVLDVFLNVPGGNDIVGNVERVDFIFDDGISTPSDAGLLDQGGHLYIEKNANNPAQLAAILSIDGSGNPSSYGPLYSLSTGDLQDATINGSNYFFPGASKPTRLL